MLRAAVLFNAKVGRAPKRRDLRLPDRARWEEALGFELPAESNVNFLFGGLVPFLHEAGLRKSTAVHYVDIEEAAVQEALKRYPDLELVRAETNHFDAYDLNGERVEIKGSHLQYRQDGTDGQDPRVYFFNFKLHKRDYRKTIDKLLCVGLGRDPETRELTQMALFEFPKGSLDLVSNKSSAMIYASSIWGYGNSQYTPYLIKKIDLGTHTYSDLDPWLRQEREEDPEAP